MARSVGVSRSLSDACCAPSFLCSAPTFLTNQPFLKPTDWFSYHPAWRLPSYLTCWWPGQGVPGHLTMDIGGDGVDEHLTMSVLPLTNQSFLKPTDWFSYHPPRGHLTLLLVGGDHVGACSVETMPCKVSSTQMSQINTSMLERAGQANILNFFFLCLFTCCQTFPDVY